MGDVRFRTNLQPGEPRQRPKGTSPPSSDRVDALRAEWNVKRRAASRASRDSEQQLIIYALEAAAFVAGQCATGDEAAERILRLRQDW